MPINLDFLSVHTHGTEQGRAGRGRGRPAGRRLWAFDLKCQRKRCSLLGEKLVSQLRRLETPKRMQCN